MEPDRFLHSLLRGYGLVRMDRAILPLPPPQWAVSVGRLLKLL